MTKVKAVFFDLGETLVTQNIEDNLVTKQALQEISVFLPITVSQRQLYRLYQRGYHLNQPVRSSHNVEIPISAWMRQLLRRALRNEPSDWLVERSARVVVRSRALNSVVFPDARQVLRVLKQDHRLGVISNVSSHEVAKEILRHVGLDKYIDLLVTSAETGIRKPDPGIFLYALDQEQVRPGEALHVGDSERNDVGGARTVGIRTIFVNKNRDRATENYSMADLTIQSLTELVDVI